MAVFPFWSKPVTEIAQSVNSSINGLSEKDAQEILRRVGPNRIQSKERVTPLGLFLNQFKSPIVLILIFATVISAFLQDWADAVIILLIVMGSALLSFFQEYNANTAAEKLQEQVSFKTDVLRDGKTASLPTDEIVPGDVVLLSAGSLIPADGLVIEARDFFVNQAVLTGETFPVEKMPGIVPESAGLAERTNVVFMGTNVRSGNAKVLIVQTGLQTAFGQIADRLTLRPPETEFERGIRKLGYLLTEVMLLLVLGIFFFNVLFHKPVAGFFALFHCAGSGTDPAAIARHHQHQPVERLTGDGETRRHRAAAGIDRELRQHGYSLHRQDRHADAGCRAVGWRAGCERRTIGASESVCVSEREHADGTAQSAG